jgi:hypothetical protein
MKSNVDINIKNVDIDNIMFVTSCIKHRTK